MRNGAGFADNVGTVDNLKIDFYNPDQCQISDTLPRDIWPDLHQDTERKILKMVQGRIQMLEFEI